MNRDALIRQVRMALDDIGPSDQIEVLGGNALIDKQLNNAAHETLMLMPVHLHPSPTQITSATRIDNETGYIVLPENFLRLVRLQLNKWKAPVSRLIHEDNPEAYRQRSVFSRGGVNKPKVVLRFNRDIARYVLEYFSTKSDDHTVKSCEVIVEQSAEDIPSILVEPMVLLCASRVLEIGGENDLSATARNRAINYFNNHQING